MCCDDKFAANPQYIFHALGRFKRNAVASSVHFTERKQFQHEIYVGQLVNHDNGKRIIRETPQYFHNVLLDALARTRQFRVYTFFLTCSAAEFHWTEIIQVFAH